MRVLVHHRDRVSRVATGLVVVGLVTSCGPAPPDDGGPFADAHARISAEERNDPEAAAEGSPPGSEPTSVGDGDEAGPAADAWLEAALVTEDDLAGRLGPERAQRWTADEVETVTGDDPDALRAFEEVFSECGPTFEWSWEQQEAWTAFMEGLDRDRPPPFTATSHRALGAVGEYLLEVEHALGEVSAGPPAAHLERLDAIGASCDPWDAEVFQAFLAADIREEDPPEELLGEGFLGIVEHLEVPPLGDGSTAWRYVFFIPESLPVYMDHVRWHRDGVVSTVTYTWSPDLTSMFELIEDTGDPSRSRAEREAEALVQLGDLAIRLDERLAAVLAAA